MGEYPEMNLYNALTGYAEKKNESLAVFHGLNLYKFDPDRNPGMYTYKSSWLLTTTYYVQQNIILSSHILKDQVEFERWWIPEFCRI